MVRAFAHDAMGRRMMQIKEPLLLIGKSSPCGGSGFHLNGPLACLTPYNRKCVECVVK